MNDIRNRLQSYLDRVQAAATALDTRSIARIVELLIAARQRDATVFVCGNGGSAATASHMAADLAKGAPVGPITGLRTIALTDSVPLLTAWGNDLGYDRVFAEQLRNLARTGDVLVAISASGNSPNVLAAVDEAHARAMTVIGLSGFGGGRLADMADVAVVADSNEYGPVEDIHLMLNHAIAESVRAGITAATHRNGQRPDTCG